MLIDTVSFYAPNTYPGLTRLWRARTSDSVLKISRLDDGDSAPLGSSIVDRVCPNTGELVRNVIQWESCSWESLRSDDRSIALQIGSCIKIQGSYARWTDNSIEGISDNVFGDPSLDLVKAVTTMASEVLRLLQFELQSDLVGEWPSELSDWTVTRCDITENFLLPSYAHVEQVIGLIRSGETGSRVVRDAHGCESVKIGGKRALYPCIIYAKGPHFKKEMRGRLGPDNGILSAVWQRVSAYDNRPLTTWLEECVTDLSFDLDALLRKYSTDDIMAADLSRSWGRAYNIGKALALSSRIFRAEARPPSRWFNETDRRGNYIHRRNCPWYKLTKDDLIEHWQKTFENLLPWNKEPLTMSNVLAKFQTASVTIGYSPSLGSKAYLTWLNVRENGAKIVRSGMSKATFARHKQIALKAGLTHAEFDTGSITTVRFDVPVTARSVNSWTELLAA